MVENNPTVEARITMATESQIRRREISLIAILTGGHFFSHAYQVLLAPLFAIIAIELKVSYIELGAILSAYSLASFIFQIPTGMLVDKFGPRWFLLGGLTFISSCIVLMGLSHSYWPLVLLSFLAGMGDSVFHPSGYKIMSARIREENLGKAYAVHNFSGYVGWFAVPLSMTFLAGLYGWRGAVIVAGLLGLAMAAILFLNRNLLNSDSFPSPENSIVEEIAKEDNEALGRWAMMVSLPMLMLLVFYATTSMANSGIRGFSPVILPKLYGMSDFAANFSLTMWFGGSMAGVLLGGIVADKFKRFDLVASMGYITGAVVIALVGFQIFSDLAVPYAYLFGGFMIGVISPSRDMMVRTIAPPERMGQAFSFVSMGFGVGGFVGPIIFGWVLDNSSAEFVFLAGAGMLLVALGVALCATVVGKKIKTAPAE